MKRLLAPAAALAAMGLALLAACDADSPESGGARYLRLQKRDVEIKLLEYGAVVAREVRSVNAPVSGEVIWLAAEGTRLKRGQVVLKMDTEELVSRLEEERKAGMGLEEQLKTKQAVAKAIVLNRKAATRNAAIDLEITRQRLAEARSHPTPREKKMAALNLKAARLRAESAAAEVKAFEGLVEDGFSSMARARAARLELVRARAELARATAAHRETMAGVQPQTIRALEAAVKKSELSLAQAKFNAEADAVKASMDVTVARTRYDVHRKRLERVNSDIASAAAKTPIDGVVALIDVWKGGSDLSPVQVGETHRRGRELLKMADVSSLRLRVHVNERDIIGIRAGQAARARLVSDPSRVYGARVARIASFADDKNRQLGSLAMEKSGLAGVNVVEVLLDLEVPAGAAPPRLGSSALVEIVISRLESVLTVPLEAVTWRDGRAFVTVKRDGGDRRVEISIRRGTSGEAVVESGLSAGDSVLLPPGVFAKKGAPDGR